MSTSVLDLLMDIPSLNMEDLLLLVSGLDKTVREKVKIPDEENKTRPRRMKLEKEIFKYYTSNFEAIKKRFQELIVHFDHEDIENCVRQVFRDFWNSFNLTLNLSQNFLDVISAADLEELMPEYEKCVIASKEANKLNCSFQRRDPCHAIDNRKQQLKNGRIKRWHFNRETDYYQTKVDMLNSWEELYSMYIGVSELVKCVDGWKEMALVKLPNIDLIKAVYPGTDGEMIRSIKYASGIANINWEFFAYPPAMGSLELQPEVKTMDLILTGRTTDTFSSLMKFLTPPDSPYFPLPLQSANGLSGSSVNGITGPSLLPNLPHNLLNCFGNLNQELGSFPIIDFTTLLKSISQGNSFVGMPVGPVTMDEEGTDSNKENQQLQF